MSACCVNFSAHRQFEAQLFRAYDASQLVVAPITLKKLSLTSAAETRSASRPGMLLRFTRLTTTYRELFENRVVAFPVEIIRARDGEFFAPEHYRAHSET
jgi:hypothetical protein